MKVLELFSGSGILSQTFRERGHDAVTYDKYYEATVKADISLLKIEELSNYDVIWMSPPCQTLSMASGNTHWTADRKPRTEKAKETLKIIEKVVQIMHYCIDNDKIFFIENPRARMRWFISDGFRKTVCYCRYGDTRMKPTDIWTNSKTWKPRPMCNRGNPDHIAAPRGSKTGTQGLKGAYERGNLPKELCIEICKSCEVEVKDDTKV